MKIPLAYYGDSVLRKKTAQITKITDEIKELAHDMFETMHAHNGIGLAAPQVHHSFALFVMQVPIKQDEDTWSPGSPRVFINPKILEVSEDEETAQEGCLSIPTLYDDVTRPIKLKVSALDLEGNFFEEEFSGLEARCILHENDHLNGVLFIDRLDKKRRKEHEKALRTIKDKYYIKK